MLFEVLEYQFETDTVYAVNISRAAGTDECLCVNVQIDFGETICPPPVEIRWTTPARGVYTRWSPLTIQDRRLLPEWDAVKTESRSACGMPVQCYLDSAGKNRVTVAVADVMTPMTITSGVVEETGRLMWTLVLFSQKTALMRRYETQLVIDTRQIAYEQAIAETAKYWKHMGLEERQTPADAFEPLYSAWYAYHQNVRTEPLLAELETAAEYGLKTVIVDDGWQTDDNGRGYAYCGIWQPAQSKIPDIRKFTDQVHQLGMKVMFWFAVPFIGKYSALRDRFAYQFLDGAEGNGTVSVLDPRYPCVREYLIACYTHAVSAWGIDGLKLDFIDSFRLTDKSADIHPDMDILSLEDAICRLLEDAYARLTAIKPDILIEFRQGYIGPIMQKYGNMLRAGDCPMDAVTNRVSTMSLRMIADKAAVHSDMLMWNYDDTAEQAAAQLINVLFSVPQISMRLMELPEQHRRMLRFYLAFWKKHRRVLLHGRLTARRPEANYSMGIAQADEKLVAVFYAEKLLIIDGTFAEIVLVNGTGEQGLYLETRGKERTYRYRIQNCMGQVTGEGSITLGAETRQFAVPVSGVVTCSEI